MSLSIIEKTGDGANIHLDARSFVAFGNISSVSP